MSVSIPITALPQEAPRGPSLWELGAELQAETRWIAQLAERLHAGDEGDHALAVADLEECLAAEESRREALHRKADAVCWVIERLRGDADYHQGQAKRFTALSRSESSRADSLEASLFGVLTRLTPGATSFRLLDHKLTSRTADQVVIDDPDAIPADLVTVATSKTPDKASIKERIKAAIAKATAGLSREEAAPLAFSLAATSVPGARLLKRRHWSIH
ncbi:MAG: siphovirus Gp157 family protein [Cyanobacteriota bacterium]|nr:siphovirus Gp157 family protein [Cyanobacteriota bacterium]